MANKQPGATVQFPLPLLALGATHKPRLDVALRHAIVSNGKRLFSKLTPAEREAKTAEFAGKVWPTDTKGHAGWVLPVQLGAKFSNVTLGSFSATLDGFNEAEAFLSAWTAAGRTAPTVRVGTTMFFEARDGSPQNYQRFACLCAANAIIGSKPYAVVTRGRVRAGMLGYSSGKVLFDDDGAIHADGAKLLAQRLDGVLPVTENQVRGLLDKLVVASLVYRFNPYRGSVSYYSKTLTPELLCVVLTRKAAKQVPDARLAAAGLELKRLREMRTA